MPRRVVELDLREERDRLEDEREQLAEQAAAAEDGPSEEVLHRAQRLEQRLRGLEWALDPPEDDPLLSGPCETVSVGALTAGEYRDVQAHAARAEGTGAASIAYAAAGLVDAPFLPADAGLETAAMHVRQCPPQFLEFLEVEIEDATSVGGSEGNGRPSFDELLAEKGGTT